MAINDYNPDKDLYKSQIIALYANSTGSNAEDREKKRLFYKMLYNKKKNATNKKAKNLSN